MADFSAGLADTARVDNDPKTGWAIDPEFNRCHVAVFATKQEVGFAAGTKLIFVLEQAYGKEHTIGRLRISATTSAGPFQPDLLPASVVTILKKSPSERSESERDELVEFYRSIDRQVIALDTRIAEHARKEPPFPETKAQTLVENPKPPKTHVTFAAISFERGRGSAARYPFCPPLCRAENSRIALIWPAGWSIPPTPLLRA